MGKILVLVVISALLLGGVYILVGSNDEFSLDNDTTYQLGQISAGSDTVEDDGVAQEPRIDASTPRVQQANDNYLSETYSSKYGFSFRYPRSYQAYETDISSSRDVVTIENDRGEGFQIFTIAYDESGPIVPERIKQDLPDMIIDEPKWADLDGVRTIVFFSEDEFLGDTFEVWPSRNGRLFQIMTPMGHQSETVQMLETWRWI